VVAVSLVLLEVLKLSSGEIGQLHDRGIIAAAQRPIA
jgi:hypothetical protein